MRSGIIRVELNASLELFLRTWPVPIVIKFKKRKDCMRITKGLIDCQRLHPRRFTLRCCLTRRNKTEHTTKKSIVPRYAGIRQSEVWISIDRLLEIVDTPP